jgi:hypothetical protein
MSAEGDAPEAGAPEIEVTPAMIEAGVLAWSQGDAEFEPVSDIVTKIYRAMRKAARRP